MALKSLKSLISILFCLNIAACSHHSELMIHDTETKHSKDTSSFENVYTEEEDSLGENFYLRSLAKAIADRHPEKHTSYFPHAKDPLEIDMLSDSELFLDFESTIQGGLNTGASGSVFLHDDYSDVVLAEIEQEVLLLEDFPEAVSTAKNSESVSEPTEPSDNVELKEVQYDVPIIMNQRVQSALSFYLSKPKVVETGLRRAGRYLPLFRRILAEEGLPQDLCYMVAVESNFHSRARSHANALGMWQFISSTGKIYDLKQSPWIDERMDVEKATRSAARYLKRLYGMFGDWSLALAGYNAGEGRVSRAIRRAKKRNRGTDYWSLRLPRETRNYVPAFMAITMIMKDPEKYGFGHVVPEPPRAVTKITLPARYALQELAERMSMPFQDLLDLNPFLIRAIPPLDQKEFSLYVPDELASVLEDSIASNPESSDRWNIYLSSVDGSRKMTRLLEKYGQLSKIRVRRGDNLWVIAKRYHTTVGRLKKWNQLRNNDFLKIGQQLRLYLPTQEVFAKMMHQSSSRSSEKYVRVIKVGKGATLSEIAQRYRTSVKKLLAWNGLKSAKSLRAGQKLIVSKSKSREVEIRGQHRVIVVQAGDTLWDISRAYGIPINTIVSLNDLKSADALYLNQKILLPRSRNDS